MYLTKDEFIVLSARKMGIYASSEICQKFNISQTAIKLADNALLQKYGIKAKSAVEAIKNFWKLRILNRSK